MNCIEKIKELTPQYWQDYIRNALDYYSNELINGKALGKVSKQLKFDEIAKNYKKWSDADAEESYQYFIKLSEEVDKLYPGDEMVYISDEEWLNIEKRVKEQMSFQQSTEQDDDE